VDFNGVRYTKSDQLRPIIEQEQNDLRKKNNPIELNKALKYPKNKIRLQIITRVSLGLKDQQ
jgi:hypothetical protein